MLTDNVEHLPKFVVVGPIAIWSEIVGELVWAAVVGAGVIGSAVVGEFDPE